VGGAAIIISSGASPFLPYNCCSIPFKSAPALLPHLFLPPQEAKLLACASLAIFSYCPSGLRGSFMRSSLYLATVGNYCPSGFKGSFIQPLHYIMFCPKSSPFHLYRWAKGGGIPSFHKIFYFGSLHSFNFFLLWANRIGSLPQKKKLDL